ncbi:uncharacterized protein LOC122231950 isoform X2 [Panthera tigris]|uniref:uncharacterized protein LOC122231950 isoform X2 n=1 Tax=Panthera tigris TaxID=9694 RepID=UPI001C6F651D|nr:uncharacterized protein LOC122231950 isoform X2 [Panthera tigris]
MGEKTFPGPCPGLLNSGVPSCQLVLFLEFPGSILHKFSRCLFAREGLSFPSLLKLLLHWLRPEDSRGPESRSTLPRDLGRCSWERWIRVTFPKCDRCLPFVTENFLDIFHSPVLLSHCRATRASSSDLCEEISGLLEIKPPLPQLPEAPRGTAHQFLPVYGSSGFSGQTHPAHPGLPDLPSLKISGCWLALHAGLSGKKEIPRVVTHHLKSISG